MRCAVLALVVLVGLGVIGAVSVVGFGLYNVSAAAGHFPGVAWLLHTTFRNSVDLRAPPSSVVPDLNADGLVRLGAGHYDSACRMCHAAPGLERNATVRSMNPEPPHVEEAVSEWAPEELFWIVKNGVRMSGMPAWPTERRDSDVWAVVAFLSKVGAMDGATYSSLTERPGADKEAPLAYCAMCHGTEGRGHDNPQVPRLDILTTDYIASSLRAYRDGQRFSGVMQHAASGLKDSEIARLASHFGVARNAGGDLNEAREHPAAAIVFGTDARDNDTPACAACHGPWDAPLALEHPSLQGQRYPYLLEQLKLWKDGARGGGHRARLMHDVIPTLNEAQIEAVADFYAKADGE